MKTKRGGSGERKVVYDVSTQFGPTVTRILNGKDRGSVKKNVRSRLETLVESLLKTGQPPDNVVMKRGDSMMGNVVSFRVTYEYRLVGYLNKQNQLVLEWFGPREGAQKAYDSIYERGLHRP